MHFETFLPVFIMFVVLGVVLPVALSELADRSRKDGKGAAAEPAPATPQSLYEQLGGAAAVDAAVDVFYRKVLGDAYVSGFFKGVDMARQASKQKAFLTMAFGGPHNYTGKDMREGHKHLVQRGLNDSHFDHILVHLRSTLAELGVGDDLIDQVIAIAESTRDDVLDKGGEAAAEPATLYEKLGGNAAVDAAVDVFYRKVLGDPYVVEFFKGVDMARQASKQKAFLTMAFGGPHNYTGKDMREGHKHLVQRGLNDSHFDHILVHLRSTLAELGVGDDLIDEVVAIAESTREDVLNR